MEIRFVSSLTSEDEQRVARALIAGAAAILDQLGIAYTLRVETTSGALVHHAGQPSACSSPPSVPGFLIT